MTKDEIILAQQARIEQLKAAIADLIQKVKLADDHLSKGDKLKALTGVRRAEVAASVANSVLRRKDDLSALRAHDAELLDDCALAAFQAGAASRDAEIHRLQMALADTEQLELGTAEKCDQLREQVAMLRDALEVTHELYANASSGYGFARPDNPHNFHCDIDCCSKEEIAAHSKACDDYAAGRKVSSDSWGIGTYCDEYTPAIKALAATEPKP